MINLKHIKLLLVLILLPFKVWADSVGTPNGEFTVNENGAAVYNVPIDIYPSGTGFDPKISLVYNSQLSGYGNVGYGINITGISAITRAGKDRFHDNNTIQKVKYEAGDNYALDGKRLYIKSGTPGTDGSTYTVEGNPYATLTLHGNDTQSNRNIWFELKDADGNVYQFKQRLECLVGHPNRTFHTVAWYVSRATNKYNDYIEYSYADYSNVLYPTSITYGRSNATNTIEFSYTDIAAVTRFTMEGGSIGYMSKKLFSITSKCQSQIYRKYTLSYNTTSDASERKYERLTTINVSNGNNESLKPISLNWNYLKGASINRKKIDILNDLEGKWHEQSKYFNSADINGDGFSDFIRFSIIGGDPNKKWLLITPSISSIDKVSGGVTYKEKIIDNIGIILNTAQVFGANVFGFLDEDNCADLIFPVSANTVASNFKDVVVFNVFWGNEISTKDTAYFNCISYDLKSGQETPLYQLFDLNGDGKDELIFLEKKKKDGYFYGNIDFISKDKMLKPNTYGNFDISKTTQGNSIKFTYSQNKEIKKMFLADCNADGLQDLILLFEGGHKIYFNNGGTNLSSVFTESNAKEVASGSQLKDYWRMEQGDFNGDGLTDFAVIAAGESKLSFLCNDGNGGFTINNGASVNVDFSENTDSNKDNDYFTIRVVDFDKDGYSDVFVSKKHLTRADEWYETKWYEMDKTQVRLFRSNGYGPVLWKQFDKAAEERDCAEAYIFTGDFNGDGYAEIANYGSPLNDANDNTFKVNGRTHINVYSFSTDVALGHLASITNGLGKKTTITYASGTNPSVYTAGNPSACSFPVKTYTLPLPLVSKVSQTNGAAGTQNVTYKYGDMRIHVKGRGMLGFSSMTVNNTTLGSKTETKVTGWDNQKYIPISVLSTTTVGGKTANNQITNTIATDAAWNGNYFSYCKEKLSTDFDNHQIKTQYTYDKAKGVLTNEKSYYDGRTDMYKQTCYSGYNLHAGKYLPNTVLYVQKHSDDSDISKVRHNYTYEDNGDIIKDVQTSMYKDKTVTLTTTYTRNAHGNILTEKKSGLNVVSVQKCYEYDDKLRLVKSYTNPASVVITYQYDSWGNIITKKDESVASNILTTTYTYDNWGALTKTVNPDGTYSSVTTAWDTTPTNDGSTYGSVYKTVTKATAQPPVTVYYDSEGREVYSSTIGLKGVNISKVTHYSSNGNVAHTVNTTGKFEDTSVLSYDSFGRLTKEINTKGATVLTSYNDRQTTVSSPTGTKRTTVDAWGLPILVEDMAGSKVIETVSYKYNSMGKPVSITSNGNSVTMTYDAAGNKTSLTDPDAGTTTYTYAEDGTILRQIDAKGVVTRYTYDDLGRIKKTQIGSDIIRNYYKNGGYGHLLLESQSMNGLETEYTYDKYGRVTTEKRNTGKGTLTNTYKYKDGLLSEKKYTGGLTVNYYYDINGYDSLVVANNKVVHRVVANTGSSNSLSTTYSFLDKMNITTTQTFTSSNCNTNIRIKNGSTVIDNYDDSRQLTTGNMLSRQKNTDMPENFQYDDLDRLIKVTHPDGTGLEMSYGKNGIMTHKSDMGTYNYDNKEHRHAVSSVTECVSSKIYDYYKVSTNFNDFGKVSYIGDDHSCINYYYGPDLQRWRSSYSNASGKSWEALYFGDYERTTEAGRIREFYYVCDNVIIVRDNLGAFKPCLVLTDGLGSILTVRDENATKVFDATYDVWGKQTVKVNSIGLMRGYTGHEHVYGYEFINMNGRIYDPILAQFLSPDNYVQDPTNSQNFNRYAYCINNPLKYTDPSGDNWILGAVIGGLSNWLSNGAQFNAKGLGYFATGALAGGIGTGLASGVNVAMVGGNFWAGATGAASVSGLSSTGFLSGFAIGASSGFASGLIMGAGNSWVAGHSFSDGLVDGLKFGSMGALCGGITGGVNGGWDAHTKGLNFWTGTTEVNLNGAYTCFGRPCMGGIIIADKIKVKYVGVFENVNVYETKLMGNIEGDYSAVTLPPFGIVTGKGVLGGDKQMMRHEFGHVLQYRLIGKWAYYTVIAPQSLASCALTNNHYNFWTETWANHLAKQYFGAEWKDGKYYPTAPLSFSHWISIKTAQLLDCGTPKQKASNLLNLSY